MASASRLTESAGSCPPGCSQPASERSGGRSVSCDWCGLAAAAAPDPGRGEAHEGGRRAGRQSRKQRKQDYRCGRNR